MPTFFNPGGRTLAGGDSTPWVTGWFMPWPQAGTDKSRAPKSQSHFELIFVLLMHGSMRPVLRVYVLRVHCSCAFPWLLSRLLCGLGDFFSFARRIFRARLTLRPNRQPAFGDQLHGPLDRDVHHSRRLIDPAVAIQMFFFLHAKLVELVALVGFQTRLAGKRS